LSDSFSPHWHDDELAAASTHFQWAHAIGDLDGVETELDAVGEEFPVD
jgi:hypothetical protein